MFRRRVVVFRRPRLLGAALIGGLGFAAGRASKRSADQTAASAAPAATPDLTAKLNELAELHRTGALTDDEYSAAKAKLLA